MRINYVFGLLDSFQDKETLHLPLWFWRLPPIMSIIHQYMYYSSYPGSFFFGTCSLAKSQIQSCGWNKGLYQVKGANNTFFTNYQIKVAFYTVYYIARRLALQRMIQETGRVKFRSPQKQCLLKSVCDLMASWNLDWSDWSHFIFCLFFICLFIFKIFLKMHLFTFQLFCCEAPKMSRGLWIFTFLSAWGAGRIFIFAWTVPLNWGFQEI